MSERKICCNYCGRELHIENEILREDALFVKKDWGYFSHRDLELHEFVLCEDCYNLVISKFKIPVSARVKQEVMDDR